MKSRDDRRVLFQEKELEIIWDALREKLNDTPTRNVRQRSAIEKIMDEFDPDAA